MSNCEDNPYTYKKSPKPGQFVSSKDYKEAMDDAPVLVTVLKGSHVLYQGTHRNCEISQTRTVTPEYGIGYQNWGQTTGMHVEPGSEKVVITLK